MEKKKNKIYTTKEIYLAYITTVDPDSYTIEGEIKKSVLALKKIKSKNTEMLIPIDENFPYYSIDEIFPITNKMKRATTFITTSEIELIVENEKRVQREETEAKTKKLSA